MVEVEWDALQNWFLVQTVEFEESVIFFEEVSKQAGSKEERTKWRDDNMDKDRISFWNFWKNKLQYCVWCDPELISGKHRKILSTIPNLTYLKQICELHIIFSVGGFLSSKGHIKWMWQFLYLMFHHVLIQYYWLNVL